MLSEFIQPGVPPVVFWLFVGLAVLIQGISKSGFAGGAGILSLPLMMLVMLVVEEEQTIVPLLTLYDMNAIYNHWHNKRWEPIVRIYVPALGGIVLGALVWWWVGQEGVERYGLPIKRFVGVIAIIFGLYILAKEASMRWVREHRFGPKSAIAAGVTAGFTSTLAHAAGPIVSLFIFSQGLGKTLFVGTVAWAFTLINLTKLPFYVGIGLVDFSVLRFDLFLIPLIPIGSFLGKWMHYRVPESLFNRVIFVLTLIAGIQLVFNIRLIQGTLEYLVR